MTEGVDRDPDVDVVLAALLDPRRLAVAGALVDTRRTIDDVVEHTGLDRPDVLQAVGVLRQAGLVEHDGDTYTLLAAMLRAAAASVRHAELPMDPTIGYGMTDAEQVVLSRFFRGRSLTTIPVDRAKRLIVLERLALEFDVGRHYTEPELNAVLHEFHPDVATLRRYLVDEEMLDRHHLTDGRPEYWRAGGRVP